MIVVLVWPIEYLLRRYEQKSYVGRVVLWCEVCIVVGVVDDVSEGLSRWVYFRSEPEDEGHKTKQGNAKPPQKNQERYSPRTLLSYSPLSRLAESTNFNSKND